MSELSKKEISKLERENKELKMIFQLNSDEIFVTDENGVCLMVNPIAEKHYGLEKDELIGMNVSEMLKNKLFYPSATLKVMEERIPVNIIQSTKDKRWLHVTSVPVYDEQGNLFRIISNSRDITELFILRQRIKEMEKTIEEYNIQLEELRREKQGSEDGIIAKNDKMVHILKLIERVAKVDSTVLLLGESGVGKTRIAKVIHNNSKRKDKPFIEVNCAAIPPSLFESELFGYEAGAFTGASSSGQAGLLEAASGGTIFLDEISELSIEHQSKLLQVLQNKTFLRVGGREQKHTDARIITATNQDLETLVKKKEFREDLYYRLSVIPIHIPPLRERKEDLLNLTLNFLEKINKRYNFNKVISPRMLDLILNHDWPGNVRELENTVERLAVVSEGSVIDTNLRFLFDDGYKSENLLQQESLNLHSQLENEDNISLKEMISLVEEKIIRHYAEKLGSTRKIAEALQSSQSTIHRKCQKYGIPTQ
jgi:PAS domain S-box-containing protein